MPDSQQHMTAREQAGHDADDVVLVANDDAHTSTRTMRKFSRNCRPDDRRWRRSSGAPMQSHEIVLTN
jgi:hypothetical protein